MEYLWRISGTTLLNRVCSIESSESLLANFSSLRDHNWYYERVIRMSQERIAKWILQAESTGRKPCSKLRMRQLDNTDNTWSRLWFQQYGLSCWLLLIGRYGTDVWALNTHNLPRNTGQRRWINRQIKSAVFIINPHHEE